MSKSIMQATSIIGSSHKAQNKPLQDYSYCMKLNNYVFLFSADGLGSSRHSDVAAKELVEHSKDFIIDLNFNLCSISDEVLPSLLKICFHNTNQWYNSKHKKDMSDYLSTLDIVGLNTKNGNLFYAHSGDGGIITRDLYGEYRYITTEQKPQNMPANYVYPFYQSDRWEFGSAEKISAVMVVTDGFLEVIHHEYFNYGDEKLYVFLCAAILESTLTPKSFSTYSKYIKKLLTERRVSASVIEKYETGFSNVKEEHMAESLLMSATDDMTIASAILPDMSQTPVLTDSNYYCEPNWSELKGKRMQDIQSKLTKINRGDD